MVSVEAYMKILKKLLIYNQLIKFRNGHRGSGSGDKAGKIMQMSAKSLPDGQAIKDLAAYLTTLK